MFHVYNYLLYQPTKKLNLYFDIHKYIWVHARETIHIKSKDDAEQMKNALHLCLYPMEGHTSMYVLILFVFSPIDKNLHSVQHIHTQFRYMLLIHNATQQMFTPIDSHIRLNTSCHILQYIRLQTPVFTDARKPSIILNDIQI